MEESAKTGSDFVVTPWKVSGSIDYDRLVKQFGTQKIDDGLKEKLHKVGVDSLFLRRNIFFSHRDLPEFLSAFDKGKPVALYTGRGPSGNTHLGHLLPWIFTLQLQKAFKCKLYFQFTDDEKFLFKDELTLEKIRRFVLENLCDLLALGIKEEDLRLVVDTRDIRELYPLALEVSKKLTFSTARSVFGFENEDNVGKIFFTSVQSAPAFLPSVEAEKPVKVLIPCAIDQDPHFRVTRDVAEKIGFQKPSMIHCRFLPSLEGTGKMSTSGHVEPIYTTDSEKDVKRKIGRAFTGGQATIEEQRKLGGNPDVCAVCAYLSDWFEPDDEKLKTRLSDYRAGKILDGENKLYLASKINEFLGVHQEKREKVRKVAERLLKDYL